MPTHGRCLTTHVGGLPRPDDLIAVKLGSLSQGAAIASRTFWP
jgi:hypothetical protein